MNQRPESTHEPSPPSPPPGSHPFGQVPPDVSPLRCSLQYVLLAWTLDSLDVCGGASTVAGGGWLCGSHWEASCGTSIRLVWVGKPTTGEQEHSLLLPLHQGGAITYNFQHP